MEKTDVKKMCATSRKMGGEKFLEKKVFPWQLNGILHTKLVAPLHSFELISGMLYAILFTCAMFQLNVSRWVGQFHLQHVV